MKISEKNGTIFGLGVILTIILIGIGTFLGRDCPECISGWETLKQEGPNFWWSAFAFSILGGASFWAFMHFYKKILDYGPVKPLLITCIIFLAIAWGKGCTDKANEAVTTEKGRPDKYKPKIDSTRIPAEDYHKLGDTVK